MTHSRRTAERLPISTEQRSVVATLVTAYFVQILTQCGVRMERGESLFSAVWLNRLVFVAVAPLGISNHGCTHPIGITSGLVYQVLPEMHNIAAKALKEYAEYFVPFELWGEGFWNEEPFTLMHAIALAIGAEVSEGTPVPSHLYQYLHPHW